MDGGFGIAADPGEQDDLAALNGTRASELRRSLDRWLAEVNAAFPVPDPQYDPAAESARLRMLEEEAMPRLEAEHARYLDPDWKPNDDWWGSQVTRD